MVINKKEHEIMPPWEQFPGYPPYDTFWRQSGEAWFVYVWYPFWQSLNTQQKADYLQWWHVPDVWRQFYFDEAFTKMLEEAD